VGLENANFIANKIIEKKLSVRQAENLVKIFKSKNNRRIGSKDPNIKDLENSIIEKIGVDVVIKNNKKNKGSVSFFYKDIDQLNRIIEIIKDNY
jgi:ParB family chromosome partitioning protein